MSEKAARQSLFPPPDAAAKAALTQAASGPGFLPGSEGRGISVRLDNFEGPLDLLLYLIRKEEVSIYDIPIARITEQYLVFLEELAGVDLDRASDFLVMAATLVGIKSRMLLPKPPRMSSDEETLLDENDPRAELVAQLLAYSKYKEIAAYLKDREREQARAYLRGGAWTGDYPRPLEGVSLGDLVAAFQEILKEAWNWREVPREEIPLREKIREILWGLSRHPEGIRFRDLFAARPSRLEVIVTFIALLELVKQSRVVAVQEKNFGEIVIKKPAPQMVVYEEEGEA